MSNTLLPTLTIEDFLTFVYIYKHKLVSVLVFALFYFLFGYLIEVYYTMNNDDKQKNKKESNKCSVNEQKYFYNIQNSNEIKIIEDNQETKEDDESVCSADSIEKYHKLMEKYSLVGDENNCVELFDEMAEKNIKSDLKIYSCMVRVFVLKNKVIQALAIFNDIKLNNIFPGIDVYENIIKICIKNQIFYDKAIELYEDSLKYEVKINKLVKEDIEKLKGRLNKKNNVNKNKYEKNLCQPLVNVMKTTMIK
jgi:hypothetical protein